MIRRRTILSLIGSAALADRARAQSGGGSTARLVVGGAPGSIADMLGRPVAETLGKLRGQTWIVENRPGAGGFNSIGEMMRSAPDGQTLLMISATAVAWNQFLFKKLPYDADNDIIPVAPLAAIPMVLVVNPKVPAKTLEEFVELAKKEPGRLTYAFGGTATPSHISFERFRALTGIQVTPVPYKSGPNALQDLLGGQVDAMLDGVPLLEPQIRSGKLRALALATSSRLPSLPDVPTVGERGFPAFDAAIWVGIGVRKGTAPDLVQKLNADINQALDSAQVKDIYGRMGAELRKSSQKDFSEFVRQERLRWGPVIQGAKISLD